MLSNGTAGGHSDQRRRTSGRRCRRRDLDPGRRCATTAWQDMRTELHAERPVRAAKKTCKRGLSTVISTTNSGSCAKPHRPLDAGREDADPDPDSERHVELAQLGDRRRGPGLARVGEAVPAGGVDDRWREQAELVVPAQLLRARSRRLRGAPGGEGVRPGGTCGHRRDCRRGKVRPCGRPFAPGRSGRSRRRRPRPARGWPAPAWSARGRRGS